MNAIVKAGDQLNLDPVDLAAFEAKLAAFQIAKKNDPKLLAALGLVLHQLGQSEQAREAYMNALMVSPGDTDTWLNLGVLYQSGGFLDEALLCFKTALKQQDDYSAAWANRAKVERALGDVEAAVASFRQAVRHDPRDPTLWLDLAICELLAGDVMAGRMNYEARLFIRADPPILPRRFPLWRGESLAGRRVLALSEQGLGDVFQFCRYIADLQALGAEVVLRVPGEMQPVLGGLLVPCALIEEIGPEDVFDFEVPLMSLPLKLASVAVEPQSRGRYLGADPERAAYWNERLNDGTSAFKIGIAWQGNAAFFDDAQRSIPLAQFSSLADMRHCRLISLQLGNGLEQLDDVAFEVERLGDGVDADGAFYDTAAVIESLELVITSDTAIAHLAGALGRPVWLALAHVPDWRWGMAGEKTPLYPTMRLFRQRTRGDWAGVFADIRAALIDLR